MNKESISALIMSQTTIGQRIKFLIDAENSSIRKFARALDISDTNIRNYIERGSKPSSDVLEKMMQTFPRINSHWLITGNGEPFLPTNENSQTTANAEKIFRSPVVGTNHGTAYQENNATPAAADVEAIKNKLALAEKEVEHLKAQLASKDDVIVSKDAVIASQYETLILLRGSYNRPN